MRTDFAKQTARKLRASSTEAEQCLWRHLRGQQSAGYRFRRQHSIGPYFADFACISHRLIIEVDGSQHMNKAKDDGRTAYLVKAGWTVLRFWNSDVLGNTEVVLGQILKELQSKSFELQPLKFLELANGPP